MVRTFVVATRPAVVAGKDGSKFLHSVVSFGPQFVQIKTLRQYLQNSPSSKIG